MSLSRQAWLARIDLEHVQRRKRSAQIASYSPQGIEVSTLLFNILPSLGAFALPELLKNDRSLKVIERMSFPLKGDCALLCHAFGLSVEISTETGNLRRQTRQVRQGGGRQIVPWISIPVCHKMSALRQQSKNATFACLQSLLFLKEKSNGMHRAKTCISWANRAA